MENSVSIKFISNFIVLIILNNESSSRHSENTFPFQFFPSNFKIKRKSK